MNGNNVVGRRDRETKKKAQKRSREKKKRRSPAGLRVQVGRRMRLLTSPRRPLVALERDDLPHHRRRVKRPVPTRRRQHRRRRNRGRVARPVVVMVLVVLVVKDVLRIVGRREDQARTLHGRRVRFDRRRQAPVRRRGRSMRRTVLGRRRRCRRPDLLDKAARPRRSSRIRRIQRDRRRLNRNRRRETGRELLIRSTSVRRRIRSSLAVSVVALLLVVVVVKRRQERQQRRGFDRHVLHLGERFRHALDRDGALRLPRREVRTARVGPAGTSSSVRRRRRQHPRPLLGDVHSKTVPAAACATARSRRHRLSRMVVLHRRSERVRAVRRHGTRRTPAGLRIEVLCPRRRRRGRPLTTLRLDLAIVLASRLGRSRNCSRVRRSLTDHVADAPSRRAEPFGRIVAQRFRHRCGLARLRPGRGGAAAATPSPSEVEFLLLKPDVVFPAPATCV